MKSLDKPIIRIIIQFVFFELLFLFLLNLGLTFLNHREIDTIYYAHINLYFLIACFAFLNLKQSKLNRFLISLFIISSTLLSTSTLFSFFAWPTYDSDSGYDYYYFIFYLHVVVNTLLLFTSAYLLVYILKPYKSLTYHFLTAFGSSISISFLIYFTYIIKFDFIENYTFILNRTNNSIFWVNFVMLLFFWYEFVKQKHNLSEYIANIVAIYTSIVGMELIHIYLTQNDLRFHNLGQYFTASLNFLMLITWTIRLHYLQSPQAKENEYYIKNYKVLYGLVEKPRVGLFEQIYHKLNRRIIWAALAIAGVASSMLFLFNQFELFITKNIFLLILLLIFFTYFAVLYWDKRWFQGIEFLIRKKNK